MSKYLSLHFIVPFYALLDSNVALTVLRKSSSGTSFSSRYIRRTTCMKIFEGLSDLEKIRQTFFYFPYHKFTKCYIQIVYIWIHFDEIPWNEIWYINIFGFRWFLVLIQKIWVLLVTFVTLIILRLDFYLKENNWLCLIPSKYPIMIYLIWVN